MSPRFISITSRDGFTFVVPREAALVAGTWQRTLSSENYIESQTGRLHLDESSEIVSTIVDYLFYHLEYKKTEGVCESEFNIPTELALQVLVTADYLDL